MGRILCIIIIYFASVFTAYGADLWAVHREPELQEAKAGVQKASKSLDSGLRRNDVSSPLCTHLAQGRKRSVGIRDHIYAIMY